MTFQTTQSYQTHILKEVFDVHNYYNSFKEKIGLFDDFILWIECRKLMDAGDYVSLFVHTNFPVSAFVGFKCTVGTIKKSFFYTFDQKNQHCGWSRFGLTHELFIGGFMKIDWMITLESNPEILQHLKEKTCNEGNTLFEDETFKDFTLCVEGKEIKVHRRVLAAASPVFATLLKNWEQTRDGRTTINGYDYDTVKAAVFYIYNKHIQIGTASKTVLDLYEFAREYKLNDPISVLDWFNSENFLKPIPPPRPPRESVRFDVKLPDLPIDDNRNFAAGDHLYKTPSLELVAWHSQSELITEIPGIRNVRTKLPENNGGFGILLMSHIFCLIFAVGFSVGYYFY